jgi:hypothetical protein
MSQSSEERLPDPSSPPPKARILPFERPQSDAQRAVQLRAQETIELERAREKFKPTPLRWVVIFIIAAIPVSLTLGAVDGILRAMQMLNAMYEKDDAERAKHAPPAPPAESEPQEPGLVLLKPFTNSQPPAAADKTAPPATKKP